MQYHVIHLGEYHKQLHMRIYQYFFSPLLGVGDGPISGNTNVNDGDNATLWQGTLT